MLQGNVWSSHAVLPYRQCPPTKTAPSLPKHGLAHKMQTCNAWTRKQALRRTVKHTRGDRQRSVHQSWALTKHIQTSKAYHQVDRLAKPKSWAQAVWNAMQACTKARLQMASRLLNNTPCGRILLLSLRPCNPLGCNTDTCAGLGRKGLLRQQSHNNLRS